LVCVSKECGILRSKIPHSFKQNFKQNFNFKKLFNFNFLKKKREKLRFSRTKLPNPHPHFKKLSTEQFEKIIYFVKIIGIMKFNKKKYV